MKPLARICLLMMILVLAACQLPSQASRAATEAGFSVTASGGTITLHNASPAVVHYVLLEEETSHRVDLYFDPTHWPSVQPGETVRVDYELVTGYTPQAERAVIHWWSPGASGPLLRVRFR